MSLQAAFHENSTSLTSNPPIATMSTPTPVYVIPAIEIRFPLPTKGRRQIYGYTLDNDWLCSYARKNGIQGGDHDLPINAVSYILAAIKFERRLWVVWKGEKPKREPVLALAVSSNKSLERMVRNITPRRVEKLRKILEETEAPTWLDVSTSS